MMKKILLGCSLLLAGCGGPSHTNVYGADGKTFTAPDLCSALIACKNNGAEAACYYDSTALVDASGKITESYVCKEVKK
jgi:hypothetical protein